MTSLYNYLEEFIARITSDFKIDLIKGVIGRLISKLGKAHLKLQAGSITPELNYTSQ